MDETLSPDQLPEQEPEYPPPDYPSDTDIPRKILIIGAGISGLFAALSFKRMSTSLNVPLNIMIFERSSPSIYHESTIDGNPAQFLVLWRWAVDLLREVGLGSRLARIARPIVTFQSSDAQTKEALVQWPPVDNITSTTESGDVDMGDPTLPAMVGVRRVDLLRLLMMALTEDGDVTIQKEAVVNEPNADVKKSVARGKTVIDFGGIKGARNADGSEIVVDTSADPHGLQVDMARGDWFERENFLARIPFLFLGYDLESFIISSSTGVVTVRFSNGHVEVCDMVVGADGINSKVRELIGSDRYPPQHAGAFICHGITRTSIPPPKNYPTELPDGTVIPDITLEDINTLIPDGSSLSIIGGGSSIGLSNLGNGMIGWNVVVAELEEGKILQEYSQQNRQNAVSRAVARTSLRPTGLSGLKPNAELLAAIDENTKLHGEPESEETDTMSKLEGKVKPAPPVGSQLSAFEVQLREQLAQRNSEIFDAQPPTEPVTKNNDGMMVARGNDARALALKSIMSLEIPVTAQAIVARTDPEFTIAMDVMDMADRWLDSFTSPGYHPGRIVMIGDAAHPIATNAHNGSVGAGLAMADGAALALLFAKYFGPYVEKDGAETTTAVGIEDDDYEIKSFEKMGLEFDAQRNEVCNALMREARYEGGWDRVENGWFRSMLRLSYKYTPVSWVKSTYAARLTRGGVKLPDERLSPFQTKVDVVEIPL
ncbi:hypothetical protein HK098_000841 [Nowakowskiella sp. JEL0407]|nr:hypothetical protein HK098_000841 [Nowakowskiella sp. JEL0407]